MATSFQAKTVNFQPSKELPVCSKMLVSPTQNDEFYLVIDTEGNIDITCFWNPIEVTDPELLQKNIDIEGNKFIHCA